MLAAAGRPIAVAVIAEITGGGMAVLSMVSVLWTCSWPRRRPCRRLAAMSPKRRRVVGKQGEGEEWRAAAEAEAEAAAAVEQFAAL